MADDKQNKSTKWIIVLIVVLVLVGLTSIFVAQYWSNDESAENDSSQVDEPAGEPADEPNDDTEQYVGLTEEEALALAEDNNTTARVVERDGESLPVTMDLRPGRLNLVIEDGKVASVTVE